MYYSVRYLQNREDATIGKNLKIAVLLPFTNVTSVPDPWKFGTDPGTDPDADPDPWIRTCDFPIRADPDQNLE